MRVSAPALAASMLKSGLSISAPKRDQVPEEQKAKLRELNKELSMLQLTSSQNLLHETNNSFVVAESLEELKATPMPKINAKVRAYVKAHPSVSASELRAQFPSMKGLRKEQLKSLKVELGVR